RVEIRAFIADKTPVEQIAAAADDISIYSEVQRVDGVTREHALARAKRELGEFKDVFESECLPASLDVKLKPGFGDPNTVRRVADRLRGLELVGEVRYGDEWITQLYRLRNIAGVAGGVLGLAFATVAIIIIGATILMGVVARGKEVAI